MLKRFRSKPPPQLLPEVLETPGGVIVSSPFSYIRDVLDLYGRRHLFARVSVLATGLVGCVLNDVVPGGAPATCKMRRA